MTLYPEWMPIARQGALVRIAWTIIGILAVASNGLFYHLYQQGEIERNFMIMAAVGTVVWIAFGTLPFLGKSLGGKR